jgi:sulfoquinovosyltransferase
MSLTFLNILSPSLSWTDDELSAAFASADLFVMPSDSETLGFVVLEAMASGIPVVGVAAGGLVDIIQNEKTGYLVSNSEDMVEFSKMTKELIENKARRIEFGAAARCNGVGKLLLLS